MKPSQMTPAFTALSAGILGAVLRESVAIPHRRRSIKSHSMGSSPSSATVWLWSSCYFSESWFPHLYSGGTSTHPTVLLGGGAGKESVYVRCLAQCLTRSAQLTLILVSPICPLLEARMYIPFDSLLLTECWAKMSAQ